MYPVGGPNALRVEFFDDEIDSIRSFDVMTQRSISRRPSVRIYPAQEFLLTPEERAQAVETLQGLLQTARTSAKIADRQQEIEAEFNSIPFEEFLKLTEEADEPKAKGRKKAEKEIKPLPNRVDRAHRPGAQFQRRAGCSAHGAHVGWRRIPVAGAAELRSYAGRIP